MNIRKGKINRALRVVLYAPEGLGKTTFAAQFPDPLFIDTEDGTIHMDVARFDRPKTWEELLEEVEYVYQHPDCCKTLVLDTADWAEKLMTEYVLRVNSWKSIETPNYGKGYVYLSEKFQELLAELDKVIAYGINVIVTAHAAMRKFEQPDETGSYDRWEMKLSKRVSPLLKEWCDMLLFANYKTLVVKGDNDKAKVQGGKRVMYASHHPCWDAKNRQGLPDEMPFAFSEIAHLFPAEIEKLPPELTPYDKLRAKMAEAEVTDEEIRKVVDERAPKNRYNYDLNTPIEEYADKFITGWILKYWDKVADLIEKGRN